MKARAKLCGWGPVESRGSHPVEVVIAWQCTKPESCWCPDGLHLTSACADHAQQERVDLASLGFTVVPWVATSDQVARATGVAA